MTLQAGNPFAEVSPLPHALPRFDVIREEHFLPAVIEGMAQQRAEAEAIAGNPEPATVENTLDALERSGQLLGRVCAVLFNLIGSVATDGLLAIEEQVVPLLTAHRDAILMDERIFERVRALYERRAELALDVETGRLLERWYLDQTRAGAGLAEADQARLREINGELSALGSAFRNRLQADTNELAVHVTDRSELDGMTPDAIKACAQAASERGLDGFLIALVLPTSQPALAVLRNRELRKRLHTASVSRGRRGNDHDTRELLTRTVNLRAERAPLLGFPDHASYAVADQTAGSVETVMTLLLSMETCPWPAVIVRGTATPPKSASGRGPTPPTSRTRGAADRRAAALGLGLLFGKDCAAEVLARLVGDQTLVRTGSGGAARDLCRG